MRILLPYSLRLGKGFEDPIIAGGIEKFCHSIYENFDDVKVVEIFSKEKHESKINSTLIKNSAENYNADIIISNWTAASFAGAKIVDSSIPIMLVCHHIPHVLSTIGVFDRLKEYNHSVFFVSSYQKMLYDKMAERIKLPPITIDGYLNSGYLTGDKPKLVEPEYECGTVGRCDPIEKRPFLLKTLLKDTDIRNLIISNSIEEGHKHYSYYKKNKHWDDVLWDKPYNEVIENLQKFKTFFSTGRETWGITALEALSCGIPLILNCDKHFTHASEPIPASPNHFKKIHDKDKDALIDAIKSFDIDRKEIQDMTWEKHSLEKWKSNFTDAISKTIDNFKRRTVYEY